MATRSKPTAACLPVELEDMRYVISKEWLSSGLSFPDTSEVPTFIEHGYQSKGGNIWLDGKLTEATILVPPSSAETTFAIVHESAFSEPDDDHLSPLFPLIEPYL